MFFERVSELCKVRNITVNKLLLEIKLDKSSFSNWKRNGNSPPVDKVAKVADYFGVSIDYLLGRTDSPVPVGGMAEPNHQPIMDLTPDEIDMVEAYRAADDRAKQVVDLTLEPWKKNAFSSKAM